MNELENTEYIGVVSGDNKKNLLKWGNIFVLPTFYKMEGQPISILEAMASKNLVVTTNHGGILDIFKDKVNGYLVKKNSIKSIQDILKNYILIHEKSIISTLLENQSNLQIKNYI